MPIIWSPEISKNPPSLSTCPGKRSRRPSRPKYACKLLRAHWHGPRKAKAVNPGQDRPISREETLRPHARCSSSVRLPARQEAKAGAYAGVILRRLRNEIVLAKLAAEPQTPVVVADKPKLAAAVCATVFQPGHETPPTLRRLIKPSLQPVHEEFRCTLSALLDPMRCQRHCIAPSQIRTPHCCELSVELNFCNRPTRRWDGAVASRASVKEPGFCHWRRG